ncbi:MAG: beta-Ala-His dipeptidase, partial [Ruminococcus sp.]|nr:beta-Ala-His dipeptidase [Candidatus Copronaster equi]
APDCTKDMATEGLDLCVDGDYLFAKGTTLGGDDGIAVAISLAILDSDLPSPALEVVITTDEETGMTGAFNIDTSVLKSKTIINIDSEAEGVFTVSCAGGNRAICTLPIKRIKNDKNAYKISVSGLTGGHSGTEIDKGRANADVLLARILLSLSHSLPFNISSVCGGEKGNAIPVKSEAIIAAEDFETLKNACCKIGEEIKNEFAETDSELEIDVIPTHAVTVFDENSTQKTIFMLNNLPNGIYAMSQSIKGLVQTSLNMGIVSTTESEVEVSFCVRSSVESQKMMLNQKMECLMSLIGGSFEIFGNYPGWQYRKDSPLRELMSEIYFEQNSRKPKIEAIHAGLECGLFAGKINDLDCISIGPDILEIHTFRERLSISSTERVYKLITETLKRMNR